MHNNHHNHQSLNEGLEAGDLARLVHNEIHIDEYKSKMGDDEDIIVISFKVGGKEPALDLVNFIEKGYNWILDADVSSGEMDDGDYIVFVEVDRTPKIASQLIELLTDLNNLTETPVEDYRLSYHKASQELAVTEENILSIIPTTPSDYRKKVAKDTSEIDSLKSAAGVNVKTTAPKNEYTESLKIAAGII